MFIQKRIPLADAITNCSVIEKIIADYAIQTNTLPLEYMICGSIRRKEETCGDGDIVFWNKDRDTLTSIMANAQLNNLISKINTTRDNKIINIVCLDGYTIELLFALENCWWFKIQYATGNTEYNMALEKRVCAKGKRLENGWIELDFMVILENLLLLIVKKSYFKNMMNLMYYQKIGIYDIN